MPDAGIRTPAAFFDRLEWHRDRMLLDDLVFRLELSRDDGWTGGDHFRFFRDRKLVDEYAEFFRRRPDIRPLRMYELGIFDGGSTAFWCELFQPLRYVAVDRAARGDSPYFTRYLASRGLTDRVQTFWQTDQANHARLIEISAQLEGPIDLVIDDCSHLYGPTLASFAALFPLLRPGGHYIIEDWSWAHRPKFDARFPGERPLTDLVVGLIEACGSSRDVIPAVTVYSGFTVVERGVLDPSRPFRLEEAIHRRPMHWPPSFRQRLRAFVTRHR